MNSGVILALMVTVGSLVLMAAPARPAPGDVVPWQRVFQATAGPRWIDRAAQIQAESRFDPRAISPVGAKGLGQAMDPTWKDYQRQGWVPKGSSPFDPIPAIQGAQRYMGWCESFCGGFEPGLGGFNAGPANIRKAQCLARSLGMPGARAWLDALPRVTGPAHARETRSYLQHNAANRTAIRQRLNAKETVHVR